MTFSADLNITQPIAILQQTISVPSVKLKYYIKIVAGSLMVIHMENLGSITKYVLCNTYFELRCFGLSVS